MKLLEDRIRKDGKVYPGNILKVDSFLNHQINIAVMDEIARELYSVYKSAGVTKILTVEASGIAVAASVARVFEVPMLFAKKAKSPSGGTEIRAKGYNVTSLAIIESMSESGEMVFR